MDLNFASRLGIVLYGAGIVAMSFMARRQLYGTREAYLASDASAQAKGRRRAQLLVYCSSAGWVLSVVLVPQLMAATAGVVAAIVCGAIPPEMIPRLDEGEFD